MYVIWDSQKARTNLKKHGVDFADAAVALEDINALTILDIDEGEYRFITLARSPSPDILYIVHTEQPEDTIRIISARRANSAEKRQYFKGEVHE